MKFLHSWLFIGSDEIGHSLNAAIWSVVFYVSFFYMKTSEWVSPVCLAVRRGTLDGKIALHRWSKYSGLYAHPKVIALCVGGVAKGSLLTFWFGLGRLLFPKRTLQLVFCWDCLDIDFTLNDSGDWIIMNRPGSLNQVVLPLTIWLYQFAKLLTSPILPNIELARQNYNPLIKKWVYWIRNGWKKKTKKKRTL